MRRRRMNLSEKVFLIKKYYSNSEDWTLVQNEFNKEYNLETTQDIEKLIHQVVKRFESTGSVAQDFYFGHGMIFKRELIEDTEIMVVREEEVGLKVELDESNSTIPIHEPITQITEEESRSMSPRGNEVVMEMESEDDDHVETQSSASESSENEDDDDEFNPVPEIATFGCQKCSLSFKTRNGFNRHNRMHHKEKRGHRVTCPKCDKTVSTSYLSTHLKVHVPLSERPIEKCEICSKIFHGDLKRHMLRCHPSERQLKHVCELCGKTLCSANALKVHMRIHTQERPYKCKLCPKDFKTANCLKFHLKVHTNDRPFPCTECGKAFMDRSTLRVHLRQHTGESPYVCHLCGKTCKQAQNLRSHMRHIHRIG